MSDRHPTLTAQGRRTLDFLREHPRAPIFRNDSGSRLTAADVERVRRFEEETVAGSLDWRPGHPPAWLEELTVRCCAEVPHYRRLGPRRFADVPPVSRADLSRDVTAFVPDSVPLDRLIQFSTSGTTGHPLLVPSHPVVAASYAAFHKRALRRFGVTLRAGRGQVGVVLVGWQRRCFTYVSVNPTMDESGLAKLNLHPDDWRHPDDRAPYLDALAPELVTGDPLSFAELLALPVTFRPRALLSTSMALGEGLRAALAARFGCPVLDVYSMNEAGPIAVADPAAGGHVLLQPRLYVEILDGEITLSGGFNFCLPLLRYRTGDHAGLQVRGGEVVLVGLHGRPPVRFRTGRGEWLNNLEVTHALGRFALAQFTVHQDRAGGVHARVRGCGDLEAVRAALQDLLAQAVTVEAAELPDKVVQYSSELAS